MALNWDCSPAKSCYDLGRARYTMDGQTTTRARDDEAATSRPPNKVRFAWQPPRAGGDRNSLGEGYSAQDVCGYPPSALGPPFGPPRYRTRALAVTFNNAQIKIYKATMISAVPTVETTEAVASVKNLCSVIKILVKIHDTLMTLSVSNSFHRKLQIVITRTSISFQLRTRQKPFGGRAGPAGELIALPRLPSWIKPVWGPGEGRGGGEGN